MCRACSAFKLAGFPVVSLASRAASRTSANKFKPLFDAAPSVPIATLIPASNRSLTGQAPEASFILELGQWITCDPESAIARMSSLLSHTI